MKLELHHEWSNSGLQKQIAVTCRKGVHIKYCQKKYLNTGQWVKMYRKTMEKLPGTLKTGQVTGLIHGKPSWYLLSANLFRFRIYPWFIYSKLRNLIVTKWLCFIIFSILKKTFTLVVVMGNEYCSFRSNMFNNFSTHLQKLPF